MSDMKESANVAMVIARAIKNPDDLVYWAAWNQACMSLPAVQSEVWEQGEYGPRSMQSMMELLPQAFMGDVVLPESLRVLIREIVGLCFSEEMFALTAEWVEAVDEVMNEPDDDTDL